MDRPRRRVTALLASLPLLAACSATSEDTDPPAPAESSQSESPSADPVSPTEEPTDEPTEEPTEEAAPPPDPVSMAALAAADLTGGDLRLGAVRERTPAYTSYDVTFRSTTAGRGRRRCGSAASSTCRPGADPSRPWCWRTATSTRPTTSAGRG